MHAALGLADVYGHVSLTVLVMEPEERQMNHSLPSRTSHINGGGEAHAAWGGGQERLRLRRLREKQTRAETHSVLQTVGKRWGHAGDATCKAAPVVKSRMPR